MSDMSEAMSLTERDSINVFRMSDEKILQFIELYKKEECLYSELYNIGQRRKEAAERIARELNIPNFQARHVRLKFKNLRNSYCQLLKKIAQSKSNGEDSSVYKPRVMWFSAMDFIRPYLSPSSIGQRQPTLVINGGVIKREPEPEPEDPDDLWELSDEVDFQEEQDFLNPEDGGDYVGFSEHDQKKRGASQTSLPVAPPKRARTEELIDQGIKDISSQISMLNENMRPKLVEGTPDLYDHFGTYVASLMRSMSTLSTRRAMELQAKIVDMITKAHT